MKTMHEPRSVDDIASDYANAPLGSAERDALSAEMDAANAWIAQQHLDAGHTAEYQVMSGFNHQAYSGRRP